jgi:uncharacterized protein (DUF2147 family)
MKRPILQILTLALLTSSSPLVIADATPPADLGRWLTASGNLEIDIEPCGQALCGTVAKVLANRSMSDPNKEMSAASKPVTGMKILSDFKPSGDSQWKGQIYNRENGKTYDCRMTLVSPKELEIRAYKVLPIFGKTQIWTRVNE